MLVNATHTQDGNGFAELGMSSLLDDGTVASEGAW
jgi:hypothetical protein